MLSHLPHLAASQRYVRNQNNLTAEVCGRLEATRLPPEVAMWGGPQARCKKLGVCSTGFDLPMQVKHAAAYGRGFMRRWSHLGCRNR